MIVKEQNNSLEGFEGWANIAPETDFFSQQDTEQELGTDAKSAIKKLSQDEVVEVVTPTGPMRTYVYRPVAKGKYPGLILFSETCIA